MSPGDRQAVDTQVESTLDIFLLLFPLRAVPNSLISGASFVVVKHHVFTPIILI
jgi:hypothetical protein